MRTERARVSQARRDSFPIFERHHLHGNGRSVNGEDVMSIMSLRVRRGAQVRVLATGPDETAALQALSAMVGVQPQELLDAE